MILVSIKIISELFVYIIVWFILYWIMTKILRNCTGYRQVNDRYEPIMEEFLNSIQISLRILRDRELENNPPLTENEIEIVITDSIKNKDEKCPICLEPLSYNTGSLSCSHNFHKICISKWLKQKSLCPVCRESIVVNLSNVNELEIPLIVEND